MTIKRAAAAGLNLPFSRERRADGEVEVTLAVRAFELARSELRLNANPAKQPDALPASARLPIYLMTI